MKKRFLSILFGLCLTTYGFGQQFSAHSNHQIPHDWKNSGSPFQDFPDYMIPTGYTVNIQKSNNDVQDLHTRVVATSLNLYNNNSYDYLADTLKFFWEGDRNQIDLDTVLIAAFGPAFPFTPLNQPNFLFGNIIQSDSVLEFYESPTGPVHLGTKTLFDENGYMELNTSKYNSGGDWLSQNQYLYDYDEHGNCLKVISMNPAGDNQWDSIMRWQYSYNAQNQLTGFTVDTWNSGWDTYSQFISIYENELWKSLTRQSWLNNQWVNTDLLEFTYDDDDQMIDYSNKVWIDDQWVNSENLIYSYDLNGRITESKMQWWNGTAWSDSSRAQFEYNGDMISTVYQDLWNSTTNDLAKYNKFTYLHNDYNQYSKITSTTWNGVDYEPSQGGDGILTIFYEDLDASDIPEKLSDDQILIYPNPASGVLNVELHNSKMNKLRILDITGKIVYETKGSVFTDQMIIPVHQLTNGIYILELQGNNLTGSKIFVVNH